MFWIFGRLETGLNYDLYVQSGPMRALVRQDNAAWQTAVVKLGESGLALDVAAREAERSRERACSVGRGGPARSRGSGLAPATAIAPAVVAAGDGEGSDDDLCDAGIVAAGDEDQLANLIEGAEDALGPYELGALMRFMGSSNESDAQRLAQHLSPEERTALVAKISQKPEAMLPTVKRIRGDHVHEADMVRAMVQASGAAAPHQKRRHTCPVYMRLAIGEHILAWQRNCGKNKKRGWPLKYWAEAQSTGRGPVSDEQPRGGERNKSERQRLRMFLHRCRELASTCSDPSSRTIKAHLRARTSTKLGRPQKAPSLRESLFSWFCSIRGSVKGRIPLSALRFHAKYLRDQYIRMAAKMLRKADVPKITPKWLIEFRREYQISLRLPNKRWKVSRPVFLERIRISWLNEIRIIYWIQLATGSSPESIDNVDQKPLHVNESGSKYQKTLAFDGGQVELKELHSATRERWTVNTYCTSDVDRACAGDNPVQMMFKGGEGVKATIRESLDQLRGSGCMGTLRHVSATTSPTGSYNTADILSYLSDVLPPWDPNRKWRILLLDAFSAHLDEDVSKLAWDRGYLLVYIGGGCTGSIQPLDTHVHGPFSRAFQELEMRDLITEADAHPHRVPILSRVELMAIVITIWQREDFHMLGAQGFEHNMFNLALDGSEDHLGSSECQEYWSALDMPSRRAQALADVKRAFETGDLPLTYESYRALLEEFPARGQMDVIREGQEDEGLDAVEDRELCEAQWDDAAGVPSPAGSDAETDGRRGGEEDRSAVVAADDGAREPDMEVCRQVHLYAEDMRRYDRMKEEAQYGRDHGISKAIDKARQAVMKKMFGKGAEDALIADAMKKMRDDEDRLQVRKRASAAKRAEDEKRVKASAAVVAEERRKNVEEKARLRLLAEAQQREQEVLDSTRAFDAQDFADKTGQKQQASNKRWVSLQRLLLMSRKLETKELSSLSRDWAKWDSCNRCSDLLFPTPASYAIQYKNWLIKLVAHLDNNRGDLVAAWWRKQLKDKVPAADVVIPALPPDLFAQARGLPDAPAPPVE